MREIKFRGRDGDDWYYGSLFVNECGHTAISAPKSFWMKPVNADTVGQYTGLKDRGGKEIFEGDIISLQGAYGSNATLVKWHDGMWCIKKDLPLCHATAIASVIGNVHDNPNLLERKP